MNVFPIDSNSTYNIFSSQSHVQAHKGAKLKFDSSPRLSVTSQTNSSAGFRVLFQTIPYQTYKIEIKANLIEGDQAFIYCESHQPNSRLIPRTNRFWPNQSSTSYTLSFQAITDRTYLGILFYSPNLNYTLHLTKFIVTHQKTPFNLSNIRYQGRIPKKISPIKTAVIVEPRPDPILIKVVEHFLRVLPSRWYVQIFHGHLNQNLINKSKSLQPYLKNQRLLTTLININNLEREDYSQLLLSPEFYQHCLGQHLLIFQTDSCLNPNSVMKVDDFLKWDYVGAAWSRKSPKKSLINPKQSVLVGNGGLSLRNRETMLKICRLIRQPRYTHLLDQHEDIVISSVLTAKLIPQAHLPDWNLSRHFSVESIYFPGAVGLHKAWEYLSPKLFAKLRMENPELTNLFNKVYF